MPSETKACPHCGNAQVRSRNPRNECGSHAENSAQYRCSDCGHTFDEPVTREKRSTTAAGTGSPLTARLAGMDPSDLPEGDA